MNVTRRTIWTVTCSECPFTADFETAHLADAASECHRHEHRISEAIGSRISGRVMDDAWPGEHIDHAAQRAQSADMAYFTFNDWVHPSIGWDLNHPLCRAKDVPSTQAASK